VLDVDTRLLRAFVAVSEELNFTRAAERLHLAQQALSAQIRQLEGRLGVALFERTTRRVGLTAAGEALLPEARSVLAALERGVGAAQRAGREGAALNVSLFPLSTTELTGTILRTFAERHPGIELSIAHAPMAEALAGLRAGRADVAFVRPPLDADGLSLVTVLTEPRVAALPSAHPLAQGDSVDPAALAREPQVYVEGADARQADFWTLAEYRGDEPMRIGARMTSFDEFFGVVAAGLAVGTCPASAAEALRAAYPGVRFVPIEGLAPSTVAVAWPAERETPAVRAFVETALEVASGD
jgi:DNA-binding transcriptional LysR family regulator